MTPDWEYTGPFANHEAERKVLGSLLHSDAVRAEVMAQVSDAHFSVPAHREIFKAIHLLDAAKEPVELETVADKADGVMLTNLGGIHYVAELLANLITVGNIAYWVRILEAKRKRREYARLGVSLWQRANTTDDDADFLEGIEGMLQKASEHVAPSEAISIAEAFTRTIAALEERAHRKAPTLSFGTKGATEFLGTHEVGKLVIIAGRPGHGKSSLLAQVLGQAAKTVTGCLWFSLEMGASECCERFAQNIGANARAMQSGNMGASDWAWVHKASSEIRETPVWIDDRAGLSIAEIISSARRWRAREGANFDRILIGVDYLQLVHGHKRTEYREQEIAEVSRELKGLAKDLKAGVIACAQLNRANEARTDKRPVLSDLRESGQIEQDADIILFVHRQELYEYDAGKRRDVQGRADLIVAKNRGGQTGIVPAIFDATRCKFTD